MILRASIHKKLFKRCMGKDKKEDKSIVNYEDIVTTGFSKDLTDVGIDFTEIGIDSFLDNEIIKDIPVVKTIFSLVKTGLAIRERCFAKNFLTFLNQYHCGKLDQKEKDEFFKKYNDDSSYREKIVSLLVKINDRYFESDQSQIAGNLFVAYVKNLISWEDYVILCRCLEGYMPFVSSYLNELESEEVPYHNPNLQPGDQTAAILQACGMGYLWGSNFYATTFGILIHQYGIKADYSRTVKQLIEYAGYKTE